MRYLKSFVVLSVFALLIFATDSVSSPEIIEITGQYDGIAKQVIDKVADSKKVPAVDELDKMLSEAVETEGISTDQIKKEIEELEKKYGDPEAGKQRGKK